MHSRLAVLSSLISLGSLLLTYTDYQFTLPLNFLEKPAAMSSYNPDQSVSSDQSVPLSPLVIPPVAMIIEGNVEQVMETSPLQLTVTTNSGRYYVALQASTVLTQQGNPVGPEILKPGVSVQISGQSSNSDAMALTAQAIEIRS